jgi:hypothetical protein
LPSGPQIILSLKVLVASVTVLFAMSLVALVMGRPRLHGRINTLFFLLTLLTVLAFEVLLQFIDVSATFSDEARRALQIHLCFAIPAAVLLPIMLLTGKFTRKGAHIAFGVIFTIMWVGTFVTGIFFLPHTGP